MSKWRYTRLQLTPPFGMTEIPNSKLISMTVKTINNQKEPTKKTSALYYGTGNFRFVKENEKKPKKDEKTPQLFFMGDIDNKNAKCYN